MWLLYECTHKKWIFFYKIEFWPEQFKLLTFFNRNPIFLSQSSPIWLENYTELIFFFFEWKLLIWLANYIFCNNIAKVTPHVPCTFRPFFLIVKGVILMNSRVLNCQKIMTSAYRIISSIFSVIQIFFGKTCFSWMKWSMTISKLFAHFNQGLKTNFLRENWKQDWNGFQVASRYEILTL